MNEYLAQQYGTNVSQEDLEKAANQEFFAKLAAEAGVDLTQFSDEQIDELYNDVMGGGGQAAQPQGPTEAEKRAEEHADYCGRKMAHAYAQELRLITEQNSAQDSLAKQASEEFYSIKAAARAPYARKHPKPFQAEEPVVPGPAEQQRMRQERLERLRQRGEQENRAHVQSLHDGGTHTHLDPTQIGKKHDSYKRLGDRVGTAGVKVRDAGKDIKDTAAKVVHSIAEHGRAAGAAMGRHPYRTGAGVAGLLAAGGGAAYAHHRHQATKEASAIDQFAIESALSKVAEAGYDLDEAGQRLFTLLTEYDTSNTKMAAASDVQTAVEIRSLELLEGAGYPVTWNF